MRPGVWFRRVMKCSPSGASAAGLPRDQPLIVPAGHVPVGAGRLFEVAVEHAGPALAVLALALLIGPPGHGHKQRGLELFGFQLAVLLPHQVQRLLVRVAHGHDHQAAFAQLVDQRLGHFFRRTGDDDLVERSVLGPALEAVADADEDVGVAQAFQRPFGPQTQRLDDLDRVHFLDQRAEHRRLIAAAGADLQHAIRGLRVQLLGHERDDERRGDGLAFADRQAHVIVGAGPLVGRHEFVPQRGPHGLQHPRILDAVGHDDLLDQKAAGLLELRRRLRGGRLRRRPRKQDRR